MVKLALVALAFASLAAAEGYWHLHGYSDMYVVAPSLAVPVYRGTTNNTYQDLQFRHRTL